MIPIYAHEAVAAAMAMLPPRFDSLHARVMLLAIGLQESRFLASRQMPTGPARGFWQFERAGGVAGVLRHQASSQLALSACARRGVPPTAQAAWEAIEHDDALAAVFARLLLFTDPAPLPGPNESPVAWVYYLRTWRPGKPHEASWPRLYSAAVEAVNGILV